MSSIFLAFLVFLIALLPIYLWWYISSMLLNEPWNRRRFLLWICIGGISVLFVWLFSMLKDTSYFYAALAIGIFVILLSITVFLLIQFGSHFARKILQKVAIANILIITCWIILLVSSSLLVPQSAVLLVMIAPLIVSSLIEESSKHLMSIWLMSQDFRFSQRDVVLFTIFVVLWFVFIENLLYFFKWQWGMWTWIFRSFFSLIAHIFSAVICAYAWWRALSYIPFSIKYISIFTLWFWWAIVSHMIYNYILQQGSIIGLLMYCAVAYVIITRSILKKS